MAGITLEQAYEIAGRKLTRADLQAIQFGVKTWDDRVKSLSSRANGRRRNRTIIYRG